MADNDSTAGNTLICGSCKRGVDILYLYEGERLCPECSPPPRPEVVGDVKGCPDG